MQIENENDMSHYYNTESQSNKEIPQNSESRENSMWHPNTQFMSQKQPSPSIQNSTMQNPGLPNPSNHNSGIPHPSMQNYGQSTYMKHPAPNPQTMPSNYSQTKVFTPTSQFMSKLISGNLGSQYSSQAPSQNVSYADTMKDQEDNPYTKYLQTSQNLDNSDRKGQYQPPQNEQQPHTQNYPSFTQNSPHQKFDHNEQMRRFGQEEQHQKPEQEPEEQPVSRVLEFNMSGYNHQQQNIQHYQQQPNQQMQQIDSYDEKPIKTAANQDFNDQPDSYEVNSNIENQPISHDDVVLPTVKQAKEQPSPNNPHDERPVGGSARPQGGTEDVPIQPKASNFEELLEKELKKNPDAAMADEGEDVPRVPKKKEFLKRKKPVTAPPKKSKPSKYKYYVDNFNEDPFTANETASKPPVKKEKQAPFSNVAERLATQEPKEDNKAEVKKKSKPKKNFLVRGGGIGGGIGSKTSGKPQKNSEKEPEIKSNRSHHRNQSKSKSKTRQKAATTKRKRIFESDSEDKENSDEDMSNDSHGKQRDSKDDFNDHSKHTKSDQSEPDMTESAAQPPHHDDTKEVKQSRGKRVDSVMSSAEKELDLTGTSLLS